MRTLVYIVISMLLFASCASQVPPQPKINGVSYVASRDSITDAQVQPLVALHANFAAIMPFGFIRDLNQPELMYNSDRQWFGETVEGAAHYIKKLREQDIKVMLKPQLWVGRGHFTGHIFMDDDLNWKKLEDSYSRFILEYAALAEREQVELFCIGTELEKFIAARPEYWANLIKQVKKIYKGKVTYAANWDECKRTPFWKELDYIGIDAYFPVSESKTPTVEECLEGWREHKQMIRTLSQKHKKPILFTEYGYRSVDYTGKEPWNADRELQDVNLQGQVNAYEALYKTFWPQDWFAGGFLWKWFVNHQEVGGEENHQFTPQNKPVEKLISQNYSEYH